MKCPHCEHKVGIFFKTLNKFGTTKVRSSCNKKIRVLPNSRFIAILITPVFAAHIFVLKPSVIAIGFSGKGMVGIWIALLIILTMQLKSAESQ